MYSIDSSSVSLKEIASQLFDHHLTDSDPWANKIFNFETVLKLKPLDHYIL